MTGVQTCALPISTPDAPGWLVLPGDLPLVLPETLRTIAAALANPDCAVAVPVYRGERGHPVGFAPDCLQGLQGLLALAGEQGAASVVRQQAQQGRMRLVDVDDAGTVTDVDTVQDLERAAVLLAERRQSTD